MNNSNKPLLFSAIVIVNIAMLLMFAAQAHFFMLKPWVFANLLYWGMYWFGKNRIKEPFAKAYLLTGLFICSVLVVIQIGEHLTNSV